MAIAISGSQSEVGAPRLDDSMQEPGTTRSSSSEEQGEAPRATAKTGSHVEIKEELTRQL